MELLMGCGSSRIKQLAFKGETAWKHLVTLDMVADHKPDFVHNLEHFPYPFADDTFDEIHAYDVMEHIGKQGDFASFFQLWSELWRIAKHDCMFFGISPHASSPWAWGDPGHTRIITLESFVFLDQSQYVRQIGKTAMSDYRPWFKGDWEVKFSHITAEKRLQWALKAIKPSRFAQFAEAA